jgi:hypothetical protein
MKDTYNKCLGVRKTLEGNLETYAINVVYKGVGDYYGFQLDGNGRFLIHDGTITHNSGKTTTMTGYSSLVDNSNLLADEQVVLWKNQKDMGIVPRLLKDVFESIKTKKDYEFTIQISYVEIYLERIRDLLNPASENLEVRENRFKGLWIDGAHEIYVASFEDAVKVMRRGELNRTVASTAMNAHSSRSHSVLVINLTQINSITTDKITSRMVFVDLAGSEKVEKTKAEGIILKQAQATNKSLLTLGLVIRAIVDKKSHVPYRDSKLTRLLTDSLGGNSKTHLIITCSPAIYNIDETISTLRFGSITQLIKNKPKINMEMNADEYKRLLQQANDQIALLQEEIDTLQSDIKAIIEMSKSIPHESLKENTKELEVLTKDIESKTKLIKELQSSIITYKNDIQIIKDEMDVIKDRLEHSISDVEMKNIEIEDMHVKLEEMKHHTEIIRTAVDSKTEEEKILIEKAQLEKIIMTDEIIALKHKVAQFADDNQALRENALKSWKDSGNVTEEKVEEYAMLQQKYLFILKSEESLKSLITSKTRHIKVMEDSLLASNGKVQELATEYKKKSIEYEKRIKDLESQLRILKSPPTVNVYTPIKF